MTDTPITDAILIKCQGAVGVKLSDAETRLLNTFLTLGGSEIVGCLEEALSTSNTNRSRLTKTLSWLATTGGEFLDKLEAEND